MLKNITFFERNKIAKSLQNALSGQNRKYQLYFTQDEINIVDLQNRRFLYPKGAFVSVAQNIAQTPLNNDKWRIYANNLRLKKLQKNSDGNYGVANLKATAEAINKMVDIADFANGAKNAEFKISPSQMRKGKLQSLPLPCGGGQRGWVDSANAESNKSCHIERSEISQKRDSSLVSLAQNDKIDCHDSLTQNLAMTENSALDSAIQIKNAESSAISQNLNLDGCFASFANPMDCHDLTSSNLAMTESNADSANRRISHENAESKIKNTHPLRHPSAREGEFLDSNSAREGEQKADFANQIKSTESTTNSQNLNTESHIAHDLQDKQSKHWLLRFAHKSYGLRCCFGLFSRETSANRTNGSFGEVLRENNSNEYPKANCQQDKHANSIYHLPPLFLPQTNIFGLCGGLFLDILLEMGYFFHSLLIYEEEAELFALSNYFVDYELLFSRTSPKSCYIFIENLLNKGLLNHYFYSKKITNNFLRLELSLLKSPKVEAFKQLTFETYRANARGWGSFEDEMVGLKNAFINAKNAPFLRLNHKLKTPICVVGSGPSLESNINFIKANQNKMLIFSCGTALKVLKAHKIRIDFQVEIERVPYLAEVLQSSNLGKTATLCASLVNPKVLELSQECLLFMRGGSAASYIFDKIAPQIAPLEFCAPFVGNAGFSLACAMSDEIIMCGMDCGFVRGFAKHASGSIYGDERAEIPADCFKVEGNCADFEVFSNAIFSLSKESFALAIAYYKPKSVHNLSFGAKIKGAIFTPNLTLKSIAKREKLPHFLISESQVDLARVDLKKGAIKFAGELTNTLNCEISSKEQLFAFIDKMSEFLAHTSQNNPKVGILFEGSMCHLLQSAMIAMLSIKSNDIKKPFCACRTAILGAIADFEAQIKEL